MSEQLGPAVVAGLFLALAIAIGGWQRRAGTCARHSRQMGRLAWALAAICLALSAALFLTLACP